MFLGELEKISEIRTKNPKSVELFRLGYNILLAISGPNASLWKLSGNHFQLASNYENVDQFLSIPLKTYRHDAMVLAQNNQSVFVFVADGYTHLQLIGDFRNFCPNCGDVDLSQAVSATNSAVFGLSTGGAIFLELEPELRDVPDKFEQIHGELMELKENFSVSFF